jgi:hypothetical protein
MIAPTRLEDQILHGLGVRAPRTELLDLLVRLFKNVLEVLVPRLEDLQAGSVERGGLGTAKRLVRPRRGLGLGLGRGLGRGRGQGRDGGWGWGVNWAMREDQNDLNVTGSRSRDRPAHIFQPTSACLRFFSYSASIASDSWRTILAWTRSHQHEYPLVASSEQQ